MEHRKSSFIFIFFWGGEKVATCIIKMLLKKHGFLVEDKTVKICTQLSNQRCGYVSAYYQKLCTEVWVTV
jgi:hypothetical protein